MCIVVITSLTIECFLSISLVAAAQCKLQTSIAFPSLKEEINMFTEQGFELGFLSAATAVTSTLFLH